MEMKSEMVLKVDRWKRYFTWKKKKAGRILHQNKQIQQGIQLASEKMKHNSIFILFHYSQSICYKVREYTVQHPFPIYLICTLELVIILRTFNFNNEWHMKKTNIRQKPQAAFMICMHKAYMHMYIKYTCVIVPKQVKLKTLPFSKLAEPKEKLTLWILNIRGALSFPWVRIWTVEPSHACR